MASRLTRRQLERLQKAQARARSERARLRSVAAARARHEQYLAAIKAGKYTVKERKEFIRETKHSQKIEAYAEGLQATYGDRFAEVGEVFLDMPHEAQISIMNEAHSLWLSYRDNGYAPLGRPLDYMIYYHTKV